MKQLLIRSVQIFALLAALALPSFAEESKRGFFEGNLLGGGRIVFFVQGNHSLSSYIFDTSGHQASFAGGAVGDTGSFSVTTSTGATLTGKVTESNVTATFLGQNITANRVSTFGETEHLGGRFSTTATSSSGSAFDLKVVVDSQKNMFLLAKQGSTVLGGFGTISLTSCAQTTPTPSPTATVSPTATPTPSATESPTATPGSTPTPTPHMRADHGSDDGSNDGGDHQFEDQDEREDHHEDADAEQFCADFTVTLVSGQIVTGHLTFSHGLLLGDFTLNGVVFHFRAPQESSENHLANISTRGFVNTGQGQLIGGFIITGGPKLVVIRAVGPSLAAQGVNPALANPKLQLIQDGKLLEENDDWQSASNASEVNKTTIAPKNAKESAILIRLEPGHYTTVVSGADNGTGIALVEVFEIDRD
jgi:hypothetical protein